MLQPLVATFGTSVSYSPDNPRLVEETYLVSNSDTNYIGYWAAKRHLLYGLQSLRKQYGMDYLYIVPSMIFGPGYDLKDIPWHFIYDIIFKLLHAKRSGTPAVLWGDGYQERELIYITDFVRFVESLLVSHVPVINVGSGTGVSIRDLASRICAPIGFG